jgi:hypothetical protein
MSTRKKSKNSGKRTKDPICEAEGVEARLKAPELAQRGNPYLCYLVYHHPEYFLLQRIFFASINDLLFSLTDTQGA